MRRGRSGRPSSLVEPTGLRLLGHVYVAQAGDYYELPEDGLPRHERLTGTPPASDALNTPR